MRNADPVAAGAALAEVSDLRLVDVQDPARDELDAVGTGADALDVKSADGHDGGARGAAAGVVDVDAGGAGRKHAGDHTFALDGDRLGDGHGTEAARIQAVDLAAGGGLGDGAREGLAGRRAAARIEVVADTRDPGSCLRLRGRRMQEQNKNSTNG